MPTAQLVMVTTRRGTVWRCPVFCAALSPYPTVILPPPSGRSPPVCPIDWGLPQLELFFSVASTNPVWRLLSVGLCLKGGGSREGMGQGDKSC